MRKLCKSEIAVGLQIFLYDMEYKVETVTPFTVRYIQDGKPSDIIHKVLDNQIIMFSVKNIPVYTNHSPTCSHEWRKDMYFSAAVYYTCKHCNLPKEKA